jgi:peptidylprolyl isomerase
MRPRFKLLTASTSRAAWVKLGVSVAKGIAMSKPARAKSRLSFATLLVAFMLPLAAVGQTPPTTPAPAKPWSQLTTSELIAAAPLDAWQDLPLDQLLYMDFESRPGVAPVRVTILLAPDLAPNHVAVVKRLVGAKFFDGRAIVRSQDNYVAQWGDGAAAVALGLQSATMEPEFDVPMPRSFPAIPLPDGDVYAKRVGFLGNFPIAWDPATRRTWLPHCYGMIGAGRDEAANSGGPAEIYAVNGHAPRALDRNVTLFGRVVRGMEHLTTLPRGSEALGFYGEGQTKPKIISIRLASTLPPDQQQRLQAIRTNHPIYTQILESRRNRRDSWTLYKAGRLEICNAPLPVRVAP